MKRIFRSLAALLIIVISFSAISFAWLASGKYLNFPSSFGGSATPAYFAGGDGSKDNPFRITNPVHLYNLAWLQYLGYFNRREGFNNDRDQTYFALDGNIDMRGRAIPPIGTEEYPFIGEFDGNGHKVTNLTISNKKGTGDLVYSPTNAKFSNNILRFVDDSKAHDIEIVGMFGVTGDYDGYFNKYKAGGHTVDGTIASVSNFYVDKIHVRSNSAKTLAGLAAGYIGGNFSNVGVYRSDIKFAANAQANGIAGEGVLSKYSLVGAYNEDLITWDDNATGGVTGWGGSIDMQRIYNRVKYAKDNHLTSYTYNQFPYNYYKGKTQITESDNTTVESKIDGSYYVRQGGTVYYLWGKQQETQEQVDSLGDNIFGGFKLTANGRNLFVNLSTEKFFMMGNDNYATIFYIEQVNSDYYMFIYKNSDKYYVRRNESTLTLTKNINNASKLTLNASVSNNDINSTKIAFDGKYFQHVGNVNYNMVESSSSATLFKFTKQPVYKTVLKYEIEENGGIRSTQTYFPINTETEKDKNGNIIKNTGYFASGSDDGIRMDIHNYTNNGKVYTINSNGKVEQDSTDVDFKKVKEECSVLQSGNGYGLHFYHAAVDTNNLYTIPNAKIKDTTYTNRQMVANSVDFKVEQKGAIRFVAGTGYTNNNSFFALYNIFRSEEDDNIITDIKEISEIYSSGNDYVYRYTDGTTSSGVAIPAGSELKFNCEWITKPGNKLIDDTLYYFAIPVNKGEYALGSRSDLIGAYLFYLDIGANNNGEGPGEVNYTMDKVRFVNSGMPLDGGNVNVSGYEPALITLSGSSTAEETAVFKRDDTVDATVGNYILRYRVDYLAANEITTGMTKLKSDLEPSTDDEQ